MSEDEYENGVESAEEEEEEDEEQQVEEKKASPVSSEQGCTAILNSVL